MLIQAIRFATEMTQKLAEWSAVEKVLITCGCLSATVPDRQSLVTVHKLLGESEREFSLLKASFNEQPDSTLKDCIEASIMLQYMPWSLMLYPLRYY